PHHRRWCSAARLFGPAAIGPQICRPRLPAPRARAQSTADIGEERVFSPCLAETVAGHGWPAARCRDALPPCLGKTGTEDAFRLPPSLENVVPRQGVKQGTRTRPSATRPCCREIRCA